MRAYKLLVLQLFLSCFSGFSEDLKSVLGADAFYRFQEVDLLSQSYRPKSFDFIQKEGFDEATQLIDRMDPEVRKQATVQMQLRMPVKLVDYSLANGYTIEFHFGSTRETLFFLGKSGLKMVNLLHAFSPMQAEFVVVEPQGQEPGRLIMTNFYDEVQILKLMSLFYAYAPQDKLLESSRVRTFDFHMIAKESYRSSYFKEAIFVLPVDVRKAVLDSGNAIYNRLMARKFGQMSLSLLRGLYGDNCIVNLRRAMQEDGMDADALKPEKYEALLLNRTALLTAREMTEFLDLQKVLSTILKANPQSTLSKLLLVGHELAIDKEPVRKQDILRRFTMTDVNPDFASLSVQFLPAKTKSGQARILFASSVRGETADSLLHVLSRIGLKDYVYFGRSQLLNAKKLELDGLLVPLKIQKSAGQQLVLSGNSFSSGYPAPVVIREGSGLLQFSSLLGVGKRFEVLAQSFDFLDDTVWYVTRASSELNVSVDVLNSLFMGEKFSERAIEEMVDLAIQRLGVEDILPFATDRDFGFATVSEKIQDYCRKLGLSQEKHGWFLKSLEKHIGFALNTPEKVAEWLNSFEMSFPGINMGIFEKFIQTPFTNEDVKNHLGRVEQALNELNLYLGLLGENPETLVIEMYGDFVTGSLTPLSPVLISVPDIAQANLIKILRSPFGSFSPGRPLLLQVVPVARTSESSVQVLLSQARQGLAKLYEREFHKTEPAVVEPRTIRAKAWLRSREIFQNLILESFFEQKSKVFRYSTSPRDKVTESEQQRLHHEFLANGLVQLRDGGHDLLKELGDMNQYKSLVEEVKTALADLERFGTLYLTW